MSGVPDLETAAPLVETTCLLCGAAGARPVTQGPDYFLRRPGQFQMVQCADCGLLYQNPRPPLHDIDRYYPDSYGSYQSATQGLRTRRGLLRKVIERGMRKRCVLLDSSVRPRDHRRKVLDVGCASGLFLEAMLTYTDWDAEGVELNHAAATATAQRLGIPVFAGPLETAHFPDASFDAVTMWDVLEHLHDPLAGLREVRRILRPGGALFVRVPNADSYVRRLAGRYWVGYDLPRHMTVFAPRTVLRALAQTGFDHPLHRYGSASYLAAIHSLRFALDDRLASPERAAAIHRVLFHPVARALALPVFALADRVADGSALEVLALAR